MFLFETTLFWLDNMYLLHPCMFQELRIEGFLVARWLDRWQEGVTAMATWIQVR
jgi:hypothetical protein